jgi:hypothetical protein
MPPSHRESTYGHSSTGAASSARFSRAWRLVPTNNTVPLFEAELANVVHRLLVELHRLFEIDDVDLVALAEDVFGHLRIPVPRLVAEMDSGFQHLTHRYRHRHTPFRVGPRPADGSKAPPVVDGREFGHPEVRVCEFARRAASVPDKSGEMGLRNGNAS